jgi:hypothetical protein
MASHKVVQGYVPVAMVGLLLVLLSRGELFLARGHKNAAILAISRWALSSSRCSDVALDYLQTAERHILAADEDLSDRNVRLLNRVRHFQRVCELTPPVESTRRSSFDLESLPYREFEQSLPGAPQWTLKAYWVDESAIELNADVLVVLKWEVANPEILYSLPEQQVARAQDTSDGKWRIWRDGDTIVQIGKARNLVWNGGFEWYHLLTASELPYYTTNFEDMEKGVEFFFLDTASNLDSIPTNIACLRGQGQVHPGLFQLIPVAEEGALFLQGATVRTEDGAQADVGGSWESPEQRYPAFAAKRVETDGHWVSYAQLIVAPVDAYQFSFRVANYGNTGTACFDDVFVLSIVHPYTLWQ